MREVSSFICPPDKHFSHSEGRGGGKHFYIEGDKHFHKGRQTFYVGGSGGYDDVDEEMDVREANFLVSQVSKLSAGAGSFRGLKCPEILVLMIMVVFFMGKITIFTILNKRKEGLH